MNVAAFVVAASCVLLVPALAKLDAREADLVENNAVPGSPVRAANNDADETMETAEVYFRPLSWYRELQKKKNQTAQPSAAAVAPTPAAKKNYYQSTLLSKTPEYCLPAKGGVVCFYKV